MAHVLTLPQTELDLYKHVVCHEAWEHIADRSGGQVKAVETDGSSGTHRECLPLFSLATYLSDDSLSYLLFNSEFIVTRHLHLGELMRFQHHLRCES